MISLTIPLIAFACVAGSALNGLIPGGILPSRTNALVSVDNNTPLPVRARKGRWDPTYFDLFCTQRQVHEKVAHVLLGRK
jgi:hypothetical protein